MGAVDKMICCKYLCRGQDDLLQLFVRFGACCGMEGMIRGGNVWCGEDDLLQLFVCLFVFCSGVDYVLQQFVLWTR